MAALEPEVVRQEDIQQLRFLLTDGLRVFDVVSIPVSDVDGAKALYADTLGFTLTRDNPISEDMRWVQLTPPGGGASVSLIAWNANALPPGAIKELYLACDDSAGTVAALHERGVTFTQAVFDTPFGTFARFNDPDGNGWQLHQGP